MENPLRFSIATRIRDHYIIDLLKPEKNDVILDLGCGIGYYCEFLSELGAKVFGADIDRDTIAFAKELYPNINFSLCDAENTSFKTNSFGKIICSEVLEHITDDDQAIKELFRITKPGGLILISVPCLEGIFGHSIKDIAHGYSESFEKHIKKGYTLKSIKDLIESNGLKLLNYNYTMTFFTELYMGFTKLAYLLLKRGPFKSEADLKNIKEDSLTMKLNKILLPLFLKIGILEDKIFARIIKGHMLILLCIKK